MFKHPVTRLFVPIMILQAVILLAIGIFVHSTVEEIRRDMGAFTNVFVSQIVKVDQSSMAAATLQTSALQSLQHEPGTGAPDTLHPVSVHTDKMKIAFIALQSVTKDLIPATGIRYDGAIAGSEDTTTKITRLNDIVVSKIQPLVKDIDQLVIDRQYSRANETIYMQLTPAITEIYSINEQLREHYAQSSDAMLQHITEQTVIVHNISLYGSIVVSTIMLVICLYLLYYYHGKDVTIDTTPVKKPRARRVTKKVAPVVEEVAPTPKKPGRKPATPKSKPVR